VTTSPRLFECGSMAKPGDLEVEKETDASHALFVTGHAVEAFKATHLRRSEGHAEETRRLCSWPTSFASLVGVGSNLIDLVRAGRLERLLGRRACELSASSVRTWMAEGV